MLKEEGRNPHTKSYIWLYCTNTDSKSPHMAYDYKPFRNGEHAVISLKALEVFVHSDDFSAATS